MQSSKIIFIIIIAFVVTVFQSCEKTEAPKDDLAELFADIVLGNLMDQEIQNNPELFPILDEREYSDAYTHANRIRDFILHTGLVQNDNIFEWGVHIIHDDTRFNSFALPGGHLYFYTGLLKFLANEAEFAAVMAHEIAHTALGHTKTLLAGTYGADTINKDFLKKHPEIIQNICSGLAQANSNLAFSSDEEYYADEIMVKYLYETAYTAYSMASVLNRMAESQKTTAFNSRHIDFGTRANRIKERWNILGAKEGLTFPVSYAEFKNSLPD